MEEFFPSSECTEQVERAKIVYERDMGRKPVSSRFLELMKGEEMTDASITSEFRKIVFDLRREAEAAPRGVNYYDYGRRIWDHFLGAEAREQPTGMTVYQQFLVDLVRGHIEYIPIEDLVFMDVEVATDRFMREIFPQLKRLALWSMGDTKTTGYQTLKIHRSGIVRLVQETLLDIVTEPQGTMEADEYLHRLGYVVDEEKKGYLFERLRLLHQNTNKELPTIVVIEDSWKNLQQIEDFIEEHSLHRLEGKFYPIWMNYSREGKTLQKENPWLFERISRRYNGIAHPNELFDPSLQHVWQDAMVWVDFDGVVVDNVAQRKYQARVKYSALMAARNALEDVSWDFS